VRATLFYLFKSYEYSPPRPIYSTSKKVRRQRIWDFFVPFDAGIYGHDAQRRRQNLHLQLRELLIFEAAHARRDAGTSPCHMTTAYSSS
jgi:hypothetical protein